MIPPLPPLGAVPLPLLAPLPPLHAGAVRALAPLPPPVLAPINVWSRCPDVNPTRPGWYVTRWRAEFPEAKLYWDGVWWCRADEHGELHQLAHANIKNWSCEWKPV